MEPIGEKRSAGKPLSSDEQILLRQKLANPQWSDEAIARSLEFSVAGSTVSRYRKKWGFPTAAQARKLDYRHLNERELNRMARVLEMMTVSEAVTIEAAGPMAQDGYAVIGSGSTQMALYTSSHRITGVWFTRTEERWLIGRALCRSIFPDARNWVRRYIRIRSRTIKFAQGAVGRGVFANMDGEESIAKVLQWIRQGEDVSKVQTASRSYELIKEEPRLRRDIEEFRADLLTYFEL